MLRFIGMDSADAVKLFVFQYIPCYGLSHPPRGGDAPWTISIHPMLRFIWDRLCIESHMIAISIHPMLRFIEKALPSLHLLHTISIHPMLRFIANPITTASASTVISIHPMLRFITETDG